MTKPAMSSLDRAAYYQSEKVDRLQEEIAVARQHVQQGFGSALIPFFDVTMTEWLGMLEADLMEAEAILADLQAERGAMQ